MRRGMSRILSHLSLHSPPKWTVCGAVGGGCFVTIKGAPGRKEQSSVACSISLPVRLISGCGDGLGRKIWQKRGLRVSQALFSSPLPCAWLVLQRRRCKSYLSGRLQNHMLCIHVLKSSWWPWVSPPHKVVEKTDSFICTYQRLLHSTIGHMYSKPWVNDQGTENKHNLNTVLYVHLHFCRTWKTCR